VNRILAGKTLHLPTEGYFAQALPPAEPEKAIAVAKPVEETIAPEPSEPSAPALTRDIAAGPGTDALAAGKPEAELLVPKPVPRKRRSWRLGKRTPRRRSSPLRHGLRTGALVGPLPCDRRKVGRSRNDVPSAPFRGGRGSATVRFPRRAILRGAEALIDFRGGIPPALRMRSPPNGNRSGWSLSPTRAARGSDRQDSARVGVPFRERGDLPPLGDGRNRFGRAPRALGHPADRGQSPLRRPHPAERGPGKARSRPPRRPSVRPPHRASRPSYADDPNAMEGFLVGIQEDASIREIPVALTVPKTGGLPAVDFGLSFLGIAARSGERLHVGGEGGAFRLVVSPERFFEAGGKKYVVDTGRMSPRSARSSGRRGTPSSWRERTFPAGRFSSV